MSENTLNAVLIESLEAELAECKAETEHIFSKRHERIMKKIFKLYEKNVRKLNIANEEKPVSKVRFNRKTVMIAIMAIIFALVAGCAVAMFVSDAFNGRIYSDNTEIFPINTSGCPETIEEVYCLSEIPEGFEIEETNYLDFYRYTFYINHKTDQTLTFYQLTKEAYLCHLDTEKHNAEQIKINNCNGLLVDYTNDDDSVCTMVWDCGDYILQLFGNFDKNDMINLAESAKICEN